MLFTPRTIRRPGAPTRYTPPQQRQRARPRSSTSEGSWRRSGGGGIQRRLLALRGGMAVGGSLSRAGFSSGAAFLKFRARRPAPWRGSPSPPSRRQTRCRVAFAGTKTSRTHRHASARPSCRPRPHRHTAGIGHETLSHRPASVPARGRRRRWSLRFDDGSCDQLALVAVLPVAIAEIRSRFDWLKLFRELRYHPFIHPHIPI